MLVIRLLLLLCCSSFAACVYFNTYYNAQKYFRQAEKARQKEEEDQVGPGGERRSGRRRSSAQTNQLYDQAAHKASKVLEKYKESELVDDAMFLMGRAFYWQGDYLTAVRTFRDLETHFSDSEFYGRARYWRALCHEAQLMREEARTIYRALFDAGKGAVAPRAGHRLAEMAYEEEDYVAAIQEYRTTLEVFPQTALRAELWLRLGETLFALEDSSRYDEALDAFAQVLKAKPSPEVEYRARLNQGRVFYVRGDAEGALRAYTRLLEERRFRPFEGQTRILIGQYYQDRHLLEKALEEYEQVRDDFPQSPSAAMALYRTGLLYLREYGEAERAAEYFQEVGQERPGSEAAGLAQEMLGYLRQLEQLRSRIVQADSLAADSLARGLAPVATLVDTAAEDSLVLAQTPEVFEALFAVAEFYRDPERMAQPDSAIRYYQEISRRFPDSAQLPRVLYSVAWIHLEMQEDAEGARPYLERLIEAYPASEHANAARQQLGLEIQITAEELGAAEFERIEAIRLQDAAALEIYIPLLDSLSRKYPGTHVGAMAAYLAASSYEDVLGDSLEAGVRFQRVLEDFPDSRYARLVEERNQVRQAGLIAKLERSIKAVGGRLKPGEQIEILALEPDSLDSVSLARKHFGFGLRAHRRGVLKKAREHYELSLEQRLNQPETLHQLGNIMWEEGFFEDAVELYRQVLVFNPGFLKSQYRLLEAYIAEGQVDSANHYLRQVVQKDRRNPEVEFLLQEYPDLNAEENPEELDMRTLETLELSPPEEDLTLSFRNLLSDLPLVRQIAEPVYPAGAPGDSARVVLDILVDKKGEVEEVEVFSGEEVFREEAAAAAREYLFYPAVQTGGEEVRVWVELVMPFQPPVPAGDGEVEPAAAEEVTAPAGSDTVSATTSDREWEEGEDPQARP